MVGGILPLASDNKGSGVAEVLTCLAETFWKDAHTSSSSHSRIAAAGPKDHGYSVTDWAEEVCHPRSDLSSDPQCLSTPSRLDGIFQLP